jgi:hypothetical protein
MADDNLRRMEERLPRLGLLLLDGLRRIPTAVREFTEVLSHYCQHAAGLDRPGRHAMIDIEVGIPGLQGLALKAIALSEALATVGESDLGFLAGVDVRATRTLVGLRGSFPAQMNAFGWGPIARPDGRHYWEEKLGGFREGYERPFFEAVISWRSDLGSLRGGTRGPSVL